MEKTSHNYQVIFAGNIQQGKNLEEVKRAIASSLRLTVDKTEALFSGSKRVLKRTATLEQAEAFVRVFANAGAIASVESADGKPVESMSLAGRPAGAGLLAPLSADLPPYRPFPGNWLYKPVLFIATAIESLLTLLYAVLLVGAILLLFYNTLVSGWLFEVVPVMALAALLSAVVLVGGSAVILLMAKPLLGLIRRKEPALELAKELEPEFFNYVAEIAALVGTRLPARILVNNGARLTVRPVWSWQGVKNRDRQLTIGLVLLAGLNSRQLAALLAQALQPWRPGFAPLLGRMLDANMRWLHHAAYESDIVDRKLREWQQRFTGVAPLLQKLASFASWSAKPAIWRMAFSRFLSRRLIHRVLANSDAAARQVAGNSALREAMEQSLLLTFAAQNTLPELQTLWNEKGELPDNIANAVVARASHYPLQMLQQLHAMQVKRISEQGSFKPSDVQRLAFADSVQEKGQYDIAAPCSAFFLRLEKLMHIMTIRYYHAHLHIPVTTNKLVRVAVKGSQEYEANQRIARFFGSAYVDFVPLRLSAQLKTLPPQTRELAQCWHSAMMKMAEVEVRAANLSMAFHGADDEVIDFSNRELLQRAGVSSALYGMSFLRGSKAEELQQQCRDSEEAYTKVIGELDKVLTPFAQRLTSALALLNAPEVQQKLFDADKLSQECRQLLAVYEKIETNYEKLRDLRLNVILLESLLSYEAMKSSPKLRDRIGELTDDIRRTLAAFAVFFKNTPFPFDSEEHYLNLLDWVQAQSSQGEGAAAEFDRGNDTVRRMALMQRLITGRLVSVALHMEAVLGLKAANGRS